MTLREKYLASNAKHCRRLQLRLAFYNTAMVGCIGYLMTFPFYHLVMGQEPGWISLLVALLSSLAMTALPRLILEIGDYMSNRNSKISFKHCQRFKRKYGLPKSLDLSGLGDEEWFRLEEA